MLDLFVASPFFGLALSFAAWCVGLWVQNKTKIFLLNPLIVATALVIAFLSVLNIPYATYVAKGGSTLSMLLGPVTAVLALNIYNTFYGRVGWQGVGQAKAVLFFLLVAVIAAVQLWLSRRREVEL